MYGMEIGDARASKTPDTIDYYCSLFFIFGTKYT